MTSIAEMREIVKWRLNIRVNVDVLVNESTIEQTLDDGTSVWQNCPSLIDQLVESIFNKRNDRQNGSGRKRRVPICVEAFDLWKEISDEFGDRGDIERLPSRADSWTDIDQLRYLALRLLNIAESIRSILDPPKRYHVDAACPSCNAKMATRVDVYGETVRVPALTVDGVNGCACLACGALWGPQKLEELALALGCPPIGLSAPAATSEPRKEPRKPFKFAWADDLT